MGYNEAAHQNIVSQSRLCSNSFLWEIWGYGCWWL